MPSGIVMIRTQAMVPANTYKIAIHQPHRTSQIMLRISLMLIQYPAGHVVRSASPGACALVALPAPCPASLCGDAAGAAHLKRLKQAAPGGPDLLDRRP